MDTILVIEDDLKVQRALQRLFEPEGFGVIIAGDGEAGVEAYRLHPPVAVILDLNLPKMSGREVCRAIRSTDQTVPILILSAVSDLVDKVLLLELGADDYVTKPFSPREVLARVRAALRRRTRPITPGETFSFDDVTIHFKKMEITHSGVPVQLTAQEFKVVKFLVENPERVISREELLNVVWGYQNYPTTRTVDNHILKLRQKLEKDPANPVHFRTMHGTGYMFVP